MTINKLHQLYGNLGPVYFYRHGTAEIGPHDKCEVLSVYWDGTTTFIDICKKGEN